ncbi:hypothetical protein [Streptomyces fungicidicus]
MGRWKSPISYLYWAQHRIDHYMRSNDQRASTRSHQITTPSLMGVTPTYSQTWNPTETWAKSAQSLERRLRGHICTFPDLQEGPVQFLQGKTPMLLGQLRYSEYETTGGLFYARHQDTAVVLFASLEHLSPVVTRRGIEMKDAPNRVWWWSSLAPDVYRWMQGVREVTGWPDDSGLRYGFRNDADFAEECFKIAVNQGDVDNSHQPWLQPFRFGHVERGCSWLAEIYWDERIEHPRSWATWPRNQSHGLVRRILIGAPFWLRTDPDAPMVHYGDHSFEERRQWGITPARPAYGTARDPARRHGPRPPRQIAYEDNGGAASVPQ